RRPASFAPCRPTVRSFHERSQCSVGMLRLGNLFDDQAIEVTKFFENDCAHRATPRKAYNFRPNVERHLERDRKARIAAAISSQCVSRAKWPVSKKRTSASGMSRLNASAPGGRKNGSFLPQAARNGGLYLRK